MSKSLLGPWLPSSVLSLDEPHSIMYNNHWCFIRYSINMRASVNYMGLRMEPI